MLCTKYISEEGQNIHKTLINPYTVPHHPQAGDLPSDVPKKER